MAIIYSYPKKTTPNAGDFLVITDSEQPAPNKNRTKSLTIGDLASFVVSSQSAITGGGTLNTIPLFTPDGSKIGDSIITQSSNASNVTITGNATVTSDLTCNNEIYTDTLIVNDDADIDGQLAVSDTATFSSTSKFFGNVTLENSGLILVNNSEEYGFIQAGSQSIDFYIGDPVASNPPLSSELVISLTDTEAVFKKGVKLEGYLKDGTGGTGAAGQVLSSTGTGVAWTSDGGGTVTGSGTTNTLPVWTDGPNGTLGDSTISQVSNGTGNDVLISAPGAADPLSVKFGTGGTVSFKVGTTEYARITSSQGGFYRDNFRYKGKLTVDRDNSSANPSLDVGDSNHTYPAAWFRNGVVISNNPSGVTVDNTSMVIGSGNNDVVSGADNCLAVGNNNQILSDSDNSLAVGQGNIIRNNADNSFAIGQSNVIDGTASAQPVRSQVLGYQNSLTGSFSSFIAGGQNTVTTNQNAVALGFGHVLAGDDSMFAFGESNTGPSGGGDNNSFMIGGNLTGSDGNMVLGFRNTTTGYPVPDFTNGLGNTKFVVSVGTVTSSNAMIITEGGVTRGGGTAQVPRVILPTVTSFEYANGTLAKAAGIPIGGLFHTAGVLKIVLSTD